jgi:hypothetical protein
MSTTNKNKKTVSEALLEMDKLSQQLKESSNATLSSLLSEAVKKYMTEAIEDADEEDDKKEFTIEDDTTDNEVENDNVSENETEVDDEISDMEDETDENKEASDEDESDEWSDFDEFKVDDDTYDLSTGENGDETLVKVYKLLKDEDQVVVKKDGETVSLKDNETGAEYVIELGDNEPVEDENDLNVEIEDESDYNDEEDETMKESKETIFEIDLGYTDNYQKKDAIQGLNNEEPSKSGKTWHKGVPTGTEKPWAGEGSSEPFEENVNEDVELSDVTAEDLQNAGVENVDENVTMPQKRKKVKNISRQNQENPKVGHHVSKNGEYKALEEKIQMLQKENKEMKAMIPQIKKAMNESVLVNVKLGRIVKLLSENATTRKEKVDIINRFNEEAKTINEAKALYESIKRELNAGVKTNAETLLEGKNMETAEKTKINETTVYQSNEIKEMLDFMKRMNKC